ncbi:hypothetical protein ACOMHN_046889 [Nucella lapillus]
METPVAGIWMYDHHGDTSGGDLDVRSPWRHQWRGSGCTITMETPVAGIWMYDHHGDTSVCRLPSMSLTAVEKVVTVFRPPKMYYVVFLF